MGAACAMHASSARRAAVHACRRVDQQQCMYACAWSSSPPRAAAAGLSVVSYMIQIRVAAWRMQRRRLARSTAILSRVATTMTAFPFLVAVAMLAMLAAVAGLPSSAAPVAAGVSTMTLSAAPQCTNQSDCTVELQAALDSGAPLVDVAPLPGGRPWIIRPVHLRSNTTVIFRPGVHVQAKRFSFHWITDSLINILHVQNVTVVAHGAKFSMWKSDYTNSSLYQPAQWRHAFWLSSCDRVTVLGGDVSLTGGDAIQVECSRVHVQGLFAHDNYRQGISILGTTDSIFEDCILLNTSGHAPSSGLQIEPWHSANVVRNVTVRRCHAGDNRGNGFVVALGALNGSSLPTSVSIEDCTVSGLHTMAGVAITSPKPEVRGTVSVRNLTVTRTACWGALIYNHAAGGNHTVNISGATFDTVAVPSTCKASSKPSPLGIGYFTWQPPPPGKVGGIYIDRSRVIDALERAFLLETDGGGKMKHAPFGVAGVSVSVTRSGPYASAGGYATSRLSPMQMPSLTSMFCANRCRSCRNQEKLEKLEELVSALLGILNYVLHCVYLAAYFS